MKTRLRTTLLCLVLTLTLSSSVSATTGITNVKTHTSAEIQEMFQYFNLSNDVNPAYTVTPDLSSYTDSGSLTDETQQRALNVLNFTRYIAGISYDVELDVQYVQKAQDASFVNAALGLVTHFPAQPSGMPDAIYRSGCDGAKTSNLSSGYFSLTANIIHGWLSDHLGETNLTCLGHRRWALNPSLGKTGFGFVQVPDSYYSSYSAMYAHDFSGSSNATGVVWPAQTMPVEYFSSIYPWSYSLGTSIPGDLNITITRQSDGETWNMSTADGYQSSGSYALIDNLGYGQPGCVIFRPANIYYTSGDVYHVEMTNASGTFADYTVTFMSLFDSTVVEPEETVEPQEPETTEIPATVTGASDWAQEELAKAVAGEYPVDLFPDRYQTYMTRGEFAHMLGSFLPPRINTIVSRFTDLSDDPKDAEMRKYILQLNQLDIIRGTSETTFSPNDLLTREEAATMLHRAIYAYDDTFTVNQDISGFSDYNLVHDWGLTGLQYMVQLGVMKGVGQNLLAPQGNLTVEEAALMCYRLYK